MSDKSPNQVTISANRTVPDQLRPEALQKVVEADNLNAFQKRQLIKQLFRTTFEMRQQEFLAALEVGKYRVAAQVSLVKNKIDVEKDTIAFGIREEFLEILAELGMRVETRQLEFMTEFGVKLKSFRRRLEAQDIDDDEKDRILKMSRNAFDRVYDRLMQLTDRIQLDASSGRAN
jgi:hypothetical protein